MKANYFILSFLSLVLFAGCAAIDKTERNILVQQNVSPAVRDRMVHGDILTLSDIIELSQRQVPPGLMIRYLNFTRAIYSLDKPALTRLNQAKVPQEVIDYLLETPSRFAPRAYYYPRPYYSYDPYYYPYYYPASPYYYGSSATIVVGSRWHH